MKYLRGLLLCLVLTGCLLPPPPVVNPTPPTPVVKVDRLLLITIDDSLDRAGNADARVLLANFSYWNSLEKAGHKYNHLEANAADKYQEEVEEAGGLPCMIVANLKTGDELESIKLPKDTDAVNAVVKKWTGK